MSIRTFIFCDICNPQGLRSIEFRRATRSHQRSGRRICDGRAWFEGNLDLARRAGWSCPDSGSHICPQCLKKSENPSL